MRLECEKFAKDVLPAVRAVIARDLLEKHGLTQKEAARRMQTTQPAISQYKNKLRGRKVKELDASKEVSRKISDLARGIARQKINGKAYEEELCDICRAVKRDILE